MPITGGATPKLEMAFGVAPLVEPTAGQWVDVVAANVVRNVTVTRGKRSVRGTHDVGHLRAELLNIDGRFDPDNVSGPYWPNLVEDLQLRFRATVGASTFDRFRGHVDSIETFYPHGRKPYAVIEARGPLWMAARHEMSTVGFPRRVTAWSPAPGAYWRLGDRDNGSTAHDETGNGRYATYGLASRSRADGGLVADVDSGAALGGVGIIAGTKGAGLVGTANGVFMLVRPSNVPASNKRLFYQIVDGSSGALELALRSDGRIVLAAGATTIATSATVLVANQWAAVGFRRSGSSWSLFVHNGDAVESVSGTHSATFTAGPPVFGGSYNSAPTFSAEFDGAVDEIAIWPNSDPGTSLGSTLGTLALTPGRDEAKFTRFGAILDLFRWPSSRRQFEAFENDIFYEAFGLAAWRSSDASGTALDALRKLAYSASAAIYETAAGKLGYGGHVLASNPPPAPAATFSLGDDANIPCRLIVPNRAQRDAANRVEVSDGTRTAAIDGVAASAAQSDLRIDTFAGSVTDLPSDVAVRAARQLGAARTRFEVVQVKLAGLTDAQRSAVLGVDLRSYVDVVLRGQTHFQRVISVADWMTPDGWQVEIGTEPLDVPYVPSARSSSGLDFVLASGALDSPAISGERWDDDGIHPSFATVNPVQPVGGEHYHRPGEVFLLVAQGWWEDAFSAGRELLIRDKVNGDILAAVTDQASNSGFGVAQQVGTVRQTAPPVGGQPVPASILSARQYSGNPLRLRAAAMGDANWAFSPDLASVRIPPSAHAARATRTAALSLSNGTDTPVDFTAADRFDLGNLHDPAVNPSRLTLARSGVYFLGAQVSYAASGAGIRRTTSVRRNGSAVVARTSHLPISATPLDANVTTLWKGSAGDWFEAMALQDTGGSLALNISAPRSPEFWAVELAGPSARATMTTAPPSGTFPNGTPVDLTWTSTRWADNATIFAPSSKYMTADRDGVWLAWASVEWTNDTGADRVLDIVLNDSIVIARRRCQTLNGSGLLVLQVWTIHKARQGDTFKVAATNTGAGTPTLTKAGEYSPEFGLALVAAP